MISAELQSILDGWQMPSGGTLQERINRMIQPALLGCQFMTSPTAILSGLQYHLSGEVDSRELADLAGIRPKDRVLDVCCYLGGSVFFLAENYGCHAAGIDSSEAFIAAANRIASLSSLSRLVSFRTGDAAQLPFEDGQFTVVWNQASLFHDESWLKEMDRMLAPGGRLALTFTIRKPYSEESGPLWSLADAIALVDRMGYTLLHASDISSRDMELGWKALDRKLADHEDEYAAVFGADWVEKVHAYFAENLQSMQTGRRGNGRLVAQKSSAE